MTTLRFRFAKYGAMRYLGHLDLLRYFQKAVRRADIPVAYSGGFSPPPDHELCHAPFRGPYQ